VIKVRTRRAALRTVSNYIATGGVSLSCHTATTNEATHMRRIDLRTVQAAHLHTIRNINRQIVLNYVREREPISRATIAREMALQRSTVSEIVESLTAEGLIEEVGEGESTGGRRPTLL